MKPNILGVAKAHVSAYCPDVLMQHPAATVWRFPSDYNHSSSLCSVGGGIDVRYPPPPTLIILHVDDLIQHFIYGTRIATDTDIYIITALSWLYSFNWHLFNSLLFKSKSKSKSHYDRQSVGQAVLASCAHLGPATNFSFPLSFSFRQLRFGILQSPLWWEDGSVICCCCWSSPAQFR
jgi:hypothetical protein